MLREERGAENDTVVQKKYKTKRNWNVSLGGVGVCVIYSPRRRKLFSTTK